MTQLKSLCVLAAFAVACGGSSSNSSTPAPLNSSNVITISAYTFSPSNLTVAAGSTVTVRNTDGFVHSVTSQSAAGQFVPGSVSGIQFDTGAFTGVQTFTIPATAVSGTVIPYFCTVHKQMMANSGQITIQ